jgi:hypothetical protein
MDQLPKGYICVVANNYTKDREIWLQTNEDYEDPVWITIEDSPEISNEINKS